MKRNEAAGAGRAGADPGCSRPHPTLTDPRGVFHPKCSCHEGTSPDPAGLCSLKKPHTLTVFAGSCPGQTWLWQGAASQPRACPRPGRARGPCAPRCPPGAVLCTSSRQSAGGWGGKQGLRDSPCRGCSQHSPTLHTEPCNPRIPKGTPKPIPFQACRGLGLLPLQAGSF